jgi:hypothetical protein
MTSVIVALDENGNIYDCAIYSLNPKSALIAFIMQTFDCNYQTYDYPDTIKGMWESNINKNHWYWEDGNVIYGSYERK